MSIVIAQEAQPQRAPYRNLSTCLKERDAFEKSVSAGALLGFGGLAGGPKTAIAVALGGFAVSYAGMSLYCVTAKPDSFQPSFVPAMAPSNQPMR